MEIKYSKSTTLMIAISLTLLALGLSMNATAKTYEKATFAGGCFWCMESYFQTISGVQKVVSGYIGGKGKNPTYDDYGQKGHIEAIQITYDSSVISYDKLLELFWRQIDPTDPDGQFCDRGYQYSTAIFYNSSDQKHLAEKSKAALDKSGLLKKPVTTKILEDNGFYPAEENHQDYSTNNPWKYKLYRTSCGRDSRLKELWGNELMHKEAIRTTSNYKKPSNDELKNKLTPLQYDITQNDATEPAFSNQYWDNNREGIYVDIVSGEPLFSSTDKYKSGTGWPSFTKPLEANNIVTKDDKGLFTTRTEVRSKQADSHLGHLFNDGPKPTGLRYCMNSAALRFIEKKDLKKEGYGRYLKLFQKQDESKELLSSESL